MKDLKITKGEWYVDYDRIPNGVSAIAEHIAIVADEWDIGCVFTNITNEGDEERNNAILIADAGNTAQKCGLLSSELLKQRDELLEALKGLVYLHMCEQEGIGSGQPTFEQWIKAVEKVRLAITRAEEK